MGRQSGFFDVEDRLWELSAKGDDLERMAALVDFERFRPESLSWNGARIRVPGRFRHIWSDERTVSRRQHAT